MIADKFYQSLPEDLRQIVDEEVANATASGREASEKMDADLIEELGGKMEVNEIADMAPFRAAVQPVYDDMVKVLGEEARSYFDRIEAAKP